MSEKLESARRNLSDAETGGIATEGFTVPDMGEYVLMPGNPRRISLMAAQWDEGTQKISVGILEGSSKNNAERGNGNPDHHSNTAETV